MIGYREYPKYSIVSRYAVYKKALLREADALFEADVIPDRESIFYLTLEELRTVVESKKCDWREISGRREAHRRYEKMMPPRVITSEGECISGHYGNRDLPKGALVGLPVSAGVAEGRARIMKSMTDAVLESDDILVTTFTDPSWTPIFLSAKAVITEVGGLMTHGAVIAREYGIPAVVGVENATVRIKEGQRIRVNGTEGVIELL
jgi:pyruvate,water dikinase